VLITSVWFGLDHYANQGLPGVEQATIVGLIFGTIFAVTGRIFMLMIAHVAFDLTALAIIYWDVESNAPTSSSNSARSPIRLHVTLPQSLAPIEIVPRCFRRFDRNGLINRIRFSLLIADANALSVRSIDSFPVI